MSGHVNKVILLGRLGADPDVKSFQSGGRIANLRLATSETWKDRQTGERKERTEWSNVTIKSDGLVGVVERYLKKGALLYVEGKLQTRKWQDSHGNDRWTTEILVSGYGGTILMLGDNRKNSGGGRNESGQQHNDDGYGGGSSGGSNLNRGNGGWDDPLDDDIGF